MRNGKQGDVVQLARKEGIIVDYETGFEVSNSATAKLGKQIGQRTQMAIKTGGLLIISGGSAKKTENESDLPEDLPGRDIFNKLDMSADQVSGMEKDQLVELKGIGEKTADAVVEYFK